MFRRDQIHAVVARFASMIKRVMALGEAIAVLHLERELESSLCR